MKTYVVDIDGTICSLTDGDYSQAKPIFERINKINSLFEQGNRIVFHTARGCLLYTSPSPRDLSTARMPSCA
mgnify:CR=1 FL=1